RRGRGSPGPPGGIGRRPTCASAAQAASLVTPRQGLGLGEPRWRAAGMTLEIDVVTLFPAMLEGPLSESIPGRIRDQGLAAIRIHDLRQWGLGRHRNVDDTPYGGGAGMVLRPEPVAAALAALRRPDSTVVLLDPGGRRFDQGTARDLAARSHLVLLCPRYEGVDERIRALVDLELTIGDYVLT